MPKPNEIAKIVALGQAYDYWTSISIERVYSVGVSFMIFSCAEIGNPAKGWANLKLKPFDPAQGQACGVNIMVAGNPPGARNGGAHPLLKINNCSEGKA